jgi:chemotaxis protein MotB
VAKKQKLPPKGAPMWIVTFSDMVTLLLTFFVLLMSMASMDKVKFSQASDSLAGAFGVLASSSTTSVTTPRIVTYAPIDDDMVTRVYRRLRSKIHELKIEKDITLVKDRGAVILRVDDAVLFEPGERNVSPAAYSILQKVAELVHPLPFNMKIEGHTDNRGDELVNWDISVARAVSVLRYLASQKLLPLNRLAASGYGSQKPLFPNDSDAERALNRRVEFVLESQGGPNDELPYLIDASEQAPF